MFWKIQDRYKPISQTSDATTNPGQFSENVATPGLCPSHWHLQGKSQIFQSFWIYLTVFNVLTASAWLILVAHVSSPRSDLRYAFPKLNADLKACSSYSPILDAVHLESHLHQFDGSVHNNSSIFRQAPSAEVDRAWDALTAEGFEITTVPASASIQSGKDPKKSVKAPSSWDQGEDEYIVQIDAFHQIHCLNELRKEIFFDYYYGDRFTNGTAPPEHMMHKQHCIHILLQNIMCHADVDIIPHKWIHYENIHQPSRPQAEPLADFNTIKKCRDFDGLLQWTRETAVKDLAAKWKSLQAPVDAVVLDGSDGYFH